MSNSNSRKIYFAGAIRGGRNDASLYQNIIIYLGSFGEVLTEHVGDNTITEIGEDRKTDSYIFERDLIWLKSASIVIAEVTIPSLGVGYELGIAEKLDIPVLCLFRDLKGKKLSAMIRGNKKFICKQYKTLKQAKDCINSFIKNLN